MIIEPVIKILSLIALPIAIILISYQNVRAAPLISQSKNTLTLEAPYQNTFDVNLGLVQDPHINLPLKTIHGFTNTTFLLDSGAAVSTLPIHIAQDLGVDLATSRRIALQGFSGVPQFAYLNHITIRIGDRDFEIPATFIQSEDSYILGRKGLFDDFTIQFDHDRHTITLSRKI